MMGRRSPALGSVLALALALALTGEVHAQTSAADKAAAEALYDEGKRLLDDDRFEEACKKFEASQRLDAGVGTLLYLGACYEKVGRVASAWATFREASSIARASGDTEREKIARDRADRLEGTLFRLTLEVAPENRSIDGFSLRRGEITVTPGAFGVPVPVDAGSYVIRASAPGHRDWSTTVLVPVGTGAQTVKVPALEAVAVAAQPEVAPPPPSGPVSGALPAVGPAAGPKPDEGSAEGQLVAGVVIGALGIVGLGIGGIATAIAVDKDADADAFCDGSVCREQEGVDLSGSARTAGNVATVAILIGGAAVAAGVVLVLTAPSDEAVGASDARASGLTSVALAPWACGGHGDRSCESGGVVMQGSFW
jgi:hypothetical protein